MATELSQELFTPDQLAFMPNGRDYELVDGHLVKLAMGNESNIVAGKLYRRLADFVENNHLGWVFMIEGGFVLSPRTVRKPDISFVRFGRIPNEHPARGYEQLAPDLAVEVVSPRDIVEELEAKIEEYRVAGVRLMWVVHPAGRTVRIYRPNGQITDLRAADTLSGEDVVPGFSCLVADLFAFPQPPAAK